MQPATVSAEKKRYIWLPSPETHFPSQSKTRDHMLSVVVPIVSAAEQSFHSPLLSSILAPSLLLVHQNVIRESSI